MYRWLAPLLLSGCLVPQSMVDHLLDRDEDGERPVVVGGTDCDDSNLHVGVFAPEVCGNGLDDDCNGAADDVGIGAITVFLDGDGDGYGDALTPTQSCTIRNGTVTIAGDCDDNNRFDHPDAIEDCTDGRDNDCDRVIDESDNPPLWFVDLDLDGYGDAAGVGIESCTPLDGRVPNADDCDDLSPLARPGADEVPYDGLDNACDGKDDFDQDGDGFRVDRAFAPMPITSSAYAPGPDEQLDCNDLDATVNQDAVDQPYDGIDADCDGTNDFDADRDGYISDQYSGTDCDDTAYDVHPDRTEVPYDGVDDDCDPSNDDDVDGDGHAAAAEGGDDCDDHDALLWSMCATCGDADLDGRKWGCDAYDPAGQDCNDLNENVWASCATCGDKDGDGRFDGCDMYNRIHQDCDDTNPFGWSTCATCADRDGDGHFGLCDRSPGPSQDCDDALVNAWLTCTMCVDLDGDGYGTGTCDAPPDCDDTDPNSATSCGACVDLDDDGSFTACDRYDTVVEDCDDDDPERGGATAEILEDGIDQDCDGDDLTVDEAHGTFVTPSGIDDPWCGTRAWPCATLNQGAQQAKDRGQGVIFLSEGAFNATPVYSSIYGGFDATSWTRGATPGVTAIVVDDAHLMMATARRIAVDGVTIRSGSNWAGGRLLRVDGVVASLEDVDLVGVSLLGGCTAANLYASSTTLQHTTIYLKCVDDVIGIDSGPINRTATNTRFFLLQSSMTLESTDAYAAQGLVTRAARVVLDATQADVTSPSDCRALDADGSGQEGSSFFSVDSRFFCHSTLSRGVGYGAHIGRFAHTNILRTQFGSDGAALSTAGWIYLQNRDAVAISESMFIAYDAFDTVSLWAGSDVGSDNSLLISSSTLISEASDFGLGIDNDNNITSTLVDCAVKASDVAVHSAGAIELHAVYLDAPCALGDRSTCDASTTSQVESCSWYSCQSVEFSVVGDAGLGGPGLDPWVPNASSPLIDAGMDLSNWSSDSDQDLLGTHRPLGPAFDIGAIELR